jgi:predicted transcriptional regulator
MLKLKEILGNYTKDELKLVCHSLNISGFAHRDKSELVERLEQTMSNKDFVLELIGALSDSNLLLLSLLLKTENMNISEESGKTQIPQLSKSTLNQNLKKLLTFGFLFIGEDAHGQSVLRVPEEFYPWIAIRIGDFGSGRSFFIFGN